MPKGPLGFPRLTDKGPFSSSGVNVIERRMGRSSGSDAVVIAKIRGAKKQQSASMLADAVSQVASVGRPRKGDSYMVSDADTVGQRDPGHHVAIIHYPDTALDESKAGSIERSLRARMEKAEAVTIRRI